MAKTKKQPLFPSGFLWGASTAAHQVEGHNKNQWTEWEHKHSSKFARKAPRLNLWPTNSMLKKLPIWQHIKYQATDPNNYISGRGVEHFTRYTQDFDILQQLNLNTFRFSIEWSRIEPSEGEWNQEAIEHYRQYIAELRLRNIEPFPTLWHWTMPVWFTKKGGFEKKQNIKYFERFVEKISIELLGDIRYVTTLNEPNAYVMSAYIVADHPPGKRNLLLNAIVFSRLKIAHRRAYKILKKHHPRIQVGISAALVNIQAKRPHRYIDQFMTQTMRYIWNWWFLNRINATQDFVGINYYLTWYYQGFMIKNPKVPLSDMGWYMEPEGLYPILIRAHDRYKKPIIICENGVSDYKDTYRRWWLEETTIAMQRALSEGVNLKGYLHWSLLDNFEWAYGWWPKFGLVEVNRKTMQRIPRESAKWWASWIKENS